MTQLATIKHKTHNYQFTFYGDKGLDDYLVRLDTSETIDENKKRVVEKLPKVNPISCLMNNIFFFRTLLQMPEVLTMEIYDYNNKYVKIKVFQQSEDYRIKLSCYHVKRY